jgi:FkbM family methyltransferase
MLRNAPLLGIRKVTMRAYPIRGIGLGRACEFIRRTVATHAPDEPVLVQDFQGSAAFLCYLKEHMGSQVFFRGAYSYPLMPLIAEHLPRDGVFLDIGANQGEITVAAAVAAAQGRVIAVEPVPKNRERLAKNVHLNGFRHVDIVPVALSDSDGELEIFDRRSIYDDGTTHEGLATLYAHGRRTEAIARVPVRTLDGLIEEWQLHRLDMVKLDIEGAEYPALRGGQQTLKKFRPVLLVEIGRDTCRAGGYEPEELHAFISESGYRILRVNEVSSPTPLAADEMGEYQNVLALPS